MKCFYNSGLGIYLARCCIPHTLENLHGELRLMPDSNDTKLYKVCRRLCGTFPLINTCLNELLGEQPKQKKSFKAVNLDKVFL